jgi:hypothetical protein
MYESLPDFKSDRTAFSLTPARCASCRGVSSFMFMASQFRLTKPMHPTCEYLPLRSIGKLMKTNDSSVITRVHRISGVSQSRESVVCGKLGQEDTDLQAHNLKVGNSQKVNW